MKKLLKPKDILLFTLAGAGDLFEEVNDPLHLVSSSYKSVYGFIPKRYKRNNFLQTLDRSLKTKDIEKVIKGDNVYLRLTSQGKTKIRRDFPILSLTQNWNRKWTLITFDIEEKAHKVRDRLRSKLKNIGLGMLQESVWLTPLPLGAEFKEFIESMGLSDSVFVMEISSFSMGDPKELARKVWGLDKFEDEYKELKEEIETTNQLLVSLRGREKKREAKLLKNELRNELGNESGNELKGKEAMHGETKERQIYKLEEKMKNLKRSHLELYVSMPLLPKELLPASLQSLQIRNLL